MGEEDELRVIGTGIRDMKKPPRATLVGAAAELVVLRTQFRFTASLMF